MNAARIVAISAPPGGGKSTYAAALAERLGGALVEYDAYDRLTRLPAAEIAAWLAAGGPYETIDVPELVDDLTALRDGRPILDRRTGGELTARRLIVLETPFGRAHPQTAALIDTSVFIDTPTDLALARKLHQFVAATLSDPGPGGTNRFVGWLDGYLGHYETVVHPAIRLQRQRVLPLADLVVVPDGTLEAGVEQIVTFLVTRAARGKQASA